MKFDTTALISLALALTASASPVSINNDATTIKANHIEEQDLTKRGDGLICMNRGPGVNRGDMIWRIDQYCDAHQGWAVKDGYSFVEDSSFDGHPLHLGIGGQGGCDWTIGMSCHDNFRKILDGCNTEGENGKQGGFYDDACASYRILFIDH